MYFYLIWPSIIIILSASRDSSLCGRSLGIQNWSRGKSGSFSCFNPFVSLYYIHFSCTTYNGTCLVQFERAIKKYFLNHIAMRSCISSKDYMLWIGSRQADYILEVLISKFEYHGHRTTAFNCLFVFIFTILNSHGATLVHLSATDHNEFVFTLDSVERYHKNSYYFHDSMVISY